MEAFLISTGVVALAEIGDKTQLLAFMLAARFRRPVPIVWGILIATLANHALAGALGLWITRVVDPGWLRWILGLSFFAMAAWALIPDKADESTPVGEGRTAWSVFTATVAAFFLVEMGDKTQVATVALAAHYAEAVAVILGTTVGMLIANVPAVIVGQKLAQRIPLRFVRMVAAGIFAGLGVAAFWT
ncbi:MAG: TMEM165/GDT1 family protein [Casimicrobiaceae bacterium]|nr:TMEM165/GDT1 family protein [Casimicrobiaceae bacterium]